MVVDKIAAMGGKELIKGDILTFSGVLQLWNRFMDLVVKAIMAEMKTIITTRTITIY